MHNRLRCQALERPGCAGERSRPQCLRRFGKCRIAGRARALASSAKSGCLARVKDNPRAGKHRLHDRDAQPRTHLQLLASTHRFSVRSISRPPAARRSIPSRLAYCPVGNSSASQRYYYADSSGSTLFVADENGNITDTFTYGPFGESNAPRDSLSSFDEIGSTSIRRARQRFDQRLSLTGRQ